MTTKKKTTAKAAEPVPFLTEIWNKLSRVDVGDHIETADVKKDGRTVYTYHYLSWSWCWTTLMSYYPESRFKYLEPETFPDGTMMIHCCVSIIDGKRKASRSMHLPVMDQSNSAIVNPNARQISDSRQRALVKCLAIFGLGLDLWAKSDIPVGTASDPLDDDQTQLLLGLYSKLSDTSKDAFRVWAGCEHINELPKSRYQPARKLLEQKLRAQSQQRTTRAGTG